jgi:hypothetical protein
MNMTNRFIVAVSAAALAVIVVVAPGRRKAEEKPRFASEAELCVALLGKDEGEVEAQLGGPDSVSEPVTPPESFTIWCYERHYRRPETGQAEVLLLHFRDGRVRRNFARGKDGLRELARGDRAEALPAATTR